MTQIQQNLDSAFSLRAKDIEDFATAVIDILALHRSPACEAIATLYHLHMQGLKAEYGLLEWPSSPKTIDLHEQWERHDEAMKKYDTIPLEKAVRIGRLTLVK